MTDKPRSGAQKLFTGLVSPATAAKMQAESESWVYQCPYCGFERSVWDAGGVRYKAAGTARVLRRCPQCGRAAWQRVVRRAAPGAPLPAVPLADPARRVRLWILGLGGLALIVVAFVAGLLWLTTTLTQPVVTAGDAFLTAVQTGHDAAAYALCTPALQQQLGGAPGLTRLVAAARPGHWAWSSRALRNGLGLLDGAVTFADGRAGTVHLTLQQVAGAWRVAALNLTPR